MEDHRSMVEYGEQQRELLDILGRSGTAGGGAAAEQKFQRQPDAAASLAKNPNATNHLQHGTTEPTAGNHAKCIISISISASWGGLRESGATRRLEDRVSARCEQPK